MTVVIFDRYVEEALIAQTNLVWAAFTSYVLSVSYARSSLSGRVVHLGTTECISMKHPTGFNSLALQATSIEAVIGATDNSLL